MTHSVPLFFLFYLFIFLSFFFITSILFISVTSIYGGFYVDFFYCYCIYIYWSGCAMITKVFFYCCVWDFIFWDIFIDKRNFGRIIGRKSAVNNLKVENLWGLFPGYDLIFQGYVFLVMIAWWPMTLTTGMLLWSFGVRWYWNFTYFQCLSSFFMIKI